MSDRLSVIANLLGDPGRAAIMLRLMEGLALPAGELATIANVAPQTASEHLAKLVKAHLLTVEQQGRHRYYRLASAEVADAVEALLVLAGRTTGEISRAKFLKPAVGSLGYARTCYSHLAGSLGVRIAEALQERGIIREHNAKAYSLDASGREWFEALGIRVPSSAVASGKLARRCLDWTERRHHLAGMLGCAMYKRFRVLGWLAPVRSSRAVRVTIDGRAQFWKLLRIPLG